MTRTYTQRLVAPPDEVFPLLCPVREADWIDGWAPVVVCSDSGAAEADCVFVTAAADGETVWYVTRHEQEAGFVEMVRITPGLTACKLTIRVKPAGNGSEATVTYMHTSLGPDGDAFVASFTETHYTRFMQDWEARLNYYLEHREMLTAIDRGDDPE